MNRMNLGQFHRPAPSQLFTPAVTTFLVLSVIGLVISLVAPLFVANSLALNPQRVFRGPVWQLLTYPFVYQSPMSSVFCMLMILFAGSTVEREWGTKSFVSLWLTVSLVCGLLWTLVSLLLGQAYLGSTSTACSYGLIAVLGMMFRGTRVSLLLVTVEIQVMAMIIIGIGVIQSLMAPITLIWVFGAAVGYAFAKIRRKRSDTQAREHLDHYAHKPGGFVDVD